MSGSAKTPLTKEAAAALGTQAKAWLAEWSAELAGFKAERDGKIAEARALKDEPKRAAALLLANDHKAASIGRHSAIVGALEEVIVRAAQIETHLGHTAD